MQLTPFCLTLSCLRVSPDSSQFFSHDSVSLSCDNQFNSSGSQVKRETLNSGVRPCSNGWGSASSGSTCIIRIAYPSDSGVYWCQSGEGGISNGINITITDRPVILESPALPVSDGATVILRCKTKKNSSRHSFHFYKDGRSIFNGSTAEMTIHRASKSDEGLYRCITAGGGESEGSWLAVKASPPPPSSASGSVSVSRLRHLVVGTPYLLSTILLGLIYIHKKRVQTITERRGSNDVVMEILT